MPVWTHTYNESAQGSLLGPFSYNVVINDMLYLIDDDVEIYNYVDDNTVCTLFRISKDGWMNAA